MGRPTGRRRRPTNLSSMASRGCAPLGSRRGGSGTPRRARRHTPARGRQRMVPRGSTRGGASAQRAPGHSRTRHCRGPRLRTRPRSRPVRLPRRRRRRPSDRDRRYAARPVDPTVPAPGSRSDRSPPNRSSRPTLGSRAGFSRPVVGVVDSGIRAGHPLIRPALARPPASPAFPPTTTTVTARSSRASRCTARSKNISTRRPTSGRRTWCLSGCSTSMCSFRMPTSRWLIP